MAEPERENHFDRLPEPLVHLILSKVEAAKPLIRCAAVCARFNRLVWQVPRVTFTLEDISSPIALAAYRTARYDSIMITTIMRMSGIQSLTVDTVLPPGAEAFGVAAGAGGGVGHGALPVGGGGAAGFVLGGGVGGAPPGGGGGGAAVSAAAVHAWAMHLRASLQSLIIRAQVRNGLPETTIQTISCCKHLQHLHLRWQPHSEGSVSAPDIAHSPSNFPVFSCLKTLVLESMGLSDNFIEQLLKHCPVLECLTLDAISGLDSPVLCGRYLRQCRVAKWASATEVLMGAMMSSVTVDAPIRHLEVHDSAKVVVPRGQQLESLKIHAHSQVVLDIKEPLRLQRLAIEGPPRVGVLSGNVRWDLRALQDLLKVATTLQELELTRVWFHRGANVRPGDLALPLDDLIGTMTDIRRLSLGPRVVDSLWHAFYASPHHLPSSTSSVVQSVKEVCLQVDRLGLEVSRCIAALLEACPCCQLMQIDASGMLDPEVEGGNDPGFFADIISLQRQHPKVAISLHIPRGMIDFRTN